MKAGRDQLSPRELELVRVLTDQLCRAMGLPVGDEDLRQCVWEMILSAYYERWRERRFWDWEQVIPEIYSALKREKQDRWAEQYGKTSLDEPLSWETAVTRGEWLAAPHGDFQNSVCFHDHLHRQGPDVCRMAYGLIGGDTVHEVRARCHWSRAHTRRVYHRLRQGVLEYMSI